MTATSVAPINRANGCEGRDVTDGLCAESGTWGGLQEDEGAGARGRLVGSHRESLALERGGQTELEAREGW